MTAQACFSLLVLLAAGCSRSVSPEELARAVLELPPGEERVWAHDELETIVICAPLSEVEAGPFMWCSDWHKAPVPRGPFPPFGPNACEAVRAFKVEEGSALQAVSLPADPRSYRVTRIQVVKVDGSTILVRVGKGVGGFFIELRRSGDRLELVAPCAPWME